MPDEPRFHRRELPLDRLVPGARSRPSVRHVEQIEASLRTLGLVEPLIVVQRDGRFEILDGNVRFHLLEDMGVKSVPCIVFPPPPTDKEQADE